MIRKLYEKLVRKYQIWSAKRALNKISSYFQRLGISEEEIMKDFEQTRAEVFERNYGMYMSEPVLAKDWLRPEEDEAWKDL